MLGCAGGCIFPLLISRFPLTPLQGALCCALCVCTVLRSTAVSPFIAALSRQARFAVCMLWLSRLPALLPPGPHTPPPASLSDHPSACWPPHPFFCLRPLPLQASDGSIHVAAAAGSALQPAAVVLLQVGSLQALASSKPEDWQVIQTSAATQVCSVRRAWNQRAWVCVVVGAGTSSTPPLPLGGLQSGTVGGVGSGDKESKFGSPLSQCSMGDGWGEGVTLWILK